MEELRRDIRVGRDQLDRGERLSREEVLTRLREARPGAFLKPEDGEGSSQSLEPNLGGIAPEYREFVHDEVRSGRYASPAEVLEAGLWLLHDAESPEDDEALEALRREIDLGIQSGENEEMIPGDEVVARLAARLTSPEIEEFVERKIRDGEFKSFSEAAAAGLRILMDEETDWDPEVLRRELQIGRDSFARGEGIPADQARQMIMNRRDEEDSA